MNYKKLLLGIFTILWIIGVLAQITYWVTIDSYNGMAFLWTIIELCFPYIILKATED